MKILILLFTLIISILNLSGCSVVSAVATSNRIEETRQLNKGKQLVPNDGQTYLISLGLETSSYLGSGDTDFKINEDSFTQPKGSYSIILVKPGLYSVYANRRIMGGGEASASIDVKNGDSVCFYVMNPLTVSARIESTKNDACDPFLRALRNQNVISKLSEKNSSISLSDVKKNDLNTNNIENAKKICNDLGFKNNTENFGNCVLRIMK